MIFAVNTTTEQFSLALMTVEGIVFAEYLISTSEKNFRGFMPAVSALFKSSDISIENIKAIAVAIGPGSFTGLRVGLAMAKGMVQGLGIPIIGVSSLEAMANQLPNTNYPICPIISSRKGEIFSALYRRDQDMIIHRLKEERSLRFEELPSMINERTLFIGNDFRIQGGAVKKTLGDMALLAFPYLWNLRASSVGAVGLERFVKQAFDDLRDLVPSYQRPPDIRPNPFTPLSKGKNTPILSESRQGH